jgi:hypothetical protein
MAAPNPPDIYIRPLCSNASLTFYWDAPTTGSAPTSYNLTVTGPGGGTCNVGTAGYYTVSGLTNGSNYTSYITSSNAGGESVPLYYRDVEPGFKPDPPITPSASAIGSDVTVSWAPPTITPVARIKWYVITDTLCNARYNTEGFNNTIAIGSVPSGTHYFTVQSVNDPGYSTRLSTSAVVITSPVTFTWNTSKYVVVTQTEVRSSNNIDWDAYATSGSTSLSNGFAIAANPAQTNLQSMFGLATSSNPSFPVYNQMPHCLYTAANGTLYQFDGGSLGTTFGSYSAGDTLSMEFVGSNMVYKQNGTTILTKTVTPGTALYMCCTAGISGATYSNISFNYQ